MSKTSRVFLGERIFNKMKESLGILYGDRFEYRGILYIYNPYMVKDGLYTDDEVIVNILERLEKERGWWIK